MGEITFILGGARSGKSQYALKLAKEKNKVAFIATGFPLDREMKRRIMLHKKKRPLHWRTFEETKDIERLLKIIGNDFECILIDCLTFWISNLILKKCSQNLIEDKINRIIAHLKKIKGRTIIVSNEVGLGIVPINKVARRFRDIAGKVNQIVAQETDEVIFMISGIPIKIRGGER